jgi:hypothetical protein
MAEMSGLYFLLAGNSYLALLLPPALEYHFAVKTVLGLIAHLH